MTLAFLLTAGSMYGQKYEAESATLAGGSAVQNLASASGGKIVAQQEGSLTFSINVSQAGFFDIYINAAAPNGEKTNIFDVDGSSSNFVMTQNTAYTKFKVVSSQKLTAGQHQVAIKKSWGWINIDYIEFVAIDPADRFKTSQTLVNSNASKEAKSLYQFLLDNYTHKIISGVMTLDSFDESNWLKQNTGKEPVVLGVDLMHTNRNYGWYNNQTPINDAKTWYGKNGIPIFTWHWRDPSRVTESFYTKETSFDISKISDPNSAEYKAMISDIDFTAGLLKGLRDNNVPVLWRPLHEAAGGWFWWGAKGAAPCKQLWQLMYDRMVNYHGLNNLIWVWTSEPGDAAWYPGDQYVDIVGRDIYKTGDHTSQIMEFNSMNDAVAGKKMITMSESGSFPDVDNLIADGAAWSWYMPWYKEFTRDATYNSLALWKKMFASDYVITLDEMPDLKTYGQVLTSVADIENAGKLYAYPTIAKSEVTISGPIEIASISVINSNGIEVNNIQTKGDKVTFSVADLHPGMYILRVNDTHTLRIVKE